MQKNKQEVKKNNVTNKKYLLSDAQCMAYILAKCPLRVLLFLIWTLPMGSTLETAWTRVVSQAARRVS
jgi:hypothetical protein